MSTWRAKRRPTEAAPEPKPHHPTAASMLPRKEDPLLTIQQSFGNQATQKLVLHDRGEPIPQAERDKLESGFGADLSDVRVHRNQEAADLALQEGADALTVGRDIYFAAGAYGPATLAHEVSHVLQQSDATLHVQSEDPTLEHEAMRASADVVSGQMASVSRMPIAPAVQRQPTAGVNQVRLLPTYSLALDGFEIDKSVLNPGHQQKLDVFATRLKSTLASSPDTFVSIVGFADAPGTEPHNLTLGQRRADAVLGYLNGKGVSIAALRAFSLGEQVAAVESKGYEAKNRRVEIDVFERRFFKPSLSLTPPMPSGVVAPQKPIDLTYHLAFHVPTPEEEVEENIRRNEEIWKQAQDVLAREKARPGTSAADAFGKAAREITKKLGLPKWVQDRAESLAQDLPSKGAQAVFDQLAADSGLDAQGKNALKAVIDALMRTKIK